MATTPLANTMLSVVSEGNEMMVGDMLDSAKSDDQKLIEYITKVISANILRYNVEGKVMWHSQIKQVDRSLSKNQALIS